MLREIGLVILVLKAILLEVRFGDCYKLTIVGESS